MSLREAIARAIYEQPKADGATDDWSALSEERKEAWRADADRVIAVLPDMQPKPIDTAPESNGSKPFLAYVPGHGWTTAYMSAAGHTFSADGYSRRIYKATHWLPQPNAPTAE